MTSKRQRDVTLGLIVVIVLVGAVLVYRVRTMAPEAFTAGPLAHATAAGQAPANNHGLTELNLPALSTGHGELPDSVRDPFRFKPKPPPPPPITARQPVMQPAGGPEDPSPPPRIPLKFFGTFESKNGLVAGLSDGRRGYYGHVGDIVEGRYRILRIGVESIDLAYLDGSGKQTIRFTGQ